MALFRKLYLYLFISSLFIAHLLPQKIITGQSARTQPVLPYMTEPAISPDKSEIAFVSGGDIWTVPASGGEARLLVSHPATESRPLYSPDGARLAFTSNRTGNGDIYVLTFSTGELKRVTFDDVNDQLDAWSRDGRWLYFSSTSRDIGSMNDIFRVSSDGGTPMQVSADRYTNEFFSSPSQDGQTLAFTARGNASAQWWRKGHSHLDESEIWLMREGAPATYTRVTEGGAKELWPMWGRSANELFYVSDRSGAQNIWRQIVGGRAERVTNFRDGRVLWPSISEDGRVIVFEHDFRIWKLDTASGQAREVAVSLRGAAAAAAETHVRMTDQIQELALSPDGKKVAFVVRGEVFAASSTEGGDAARVTNNPAEESQINWSPDSRRIVYVSDRDGTPHIFLYDFTTNAETQLTRADAEDSAPRFSPDGKWLAFQRGDSELRLMDVSSRQERLLANAKFEMPPISPARPFVWSPDSRWIAFLPVSENLFSNVYVVPVEGGQARPVSFLANVGNNTLSWSPDGTFILFITGQRTENGQLARIDLIQRTPRFREDQFRELFREEQPRTLAPNQPRKRSR